MSAPADISLDPRPEQPPDRPRGGMNRETQSIVVGMLGGLLIAITLSGRFTSYVKPGFAPLLLIGGGILVVVGLLSLVMTVQEESRAHREGAERERGHDHPAGPAGDHSGHDRSGHDRSADGQVNRGPADRDRSDLDAGTDHPGTDHPGTDHSGTDHSGTDHSGTEHASTDHAGHDHDHDGSRAPWLMLVPVLVLLLVAPPALGADSVSRTARSQALNGVELVSADTPVSARDTMGGAAARANGGTAATGAGSGSGGMAFEPLPAGTNPPLGLQQLVLRALYDPTQVLATTPVTVTGFVAPAGDGFTGGYSIARMVINCCAADANPMQIHVEGTAPVPGDTWVSAVVTAVPGSGSAANNYVPTVTVLSMTTVPQPADPYEH